MAENKNNKNNKDNKAKKEKQTKYVNSVLAWGLICAEILVICIISLIVFM